MQTSGERGNEMAEVLMDFPEVRILNTLHFEHYTDDPPTAHHRRRGPQGAYHEAYLLDRQHLQHARGRP